MEGVNINVVGSQDKAPRYEDLNLEEEEKYLDIEVTTLQARGQGSNKDN